MSPTGPVIHLNPVVFLEVHAHEHSNTLQFSKKMCQKQARGNDDIMCATFRPTEKLVHVLL